MSNFTNIVKEKLRARFDPYSKMNDTELDNLSKEINGDEEKLTDISNYFNDDEQIELVSNGIKLTTAKEYTIESLGKNPIWNGRITNKFRKWLKTRYPDEIELIKDIDDIQEAIEEVKNNEKKTPDDDFDIFEEEDTKPINNTEDKKIEIENPKFDLVVQEQHEALPIKEFKPKIYPSEEEIKFLIKRHKFVKSELLEKHDIVNIKNNKYIKKSGWRKFINAFGISIELIEQKVYEQFGDKHAEIRVRAVAPNGQSVEGIGIKSWSELYDKNMHNLIATAWTRAVNRAVSDLVGYGEVSAEELSKQEAETNEGDDFF